MGFLLDFTAGPRAAFARGLMRGLAAPVTLFVHNEALALPGVQPVEPPAAGPGADQQVVIQQSQYTGQIPHPDILKQFDQLIPGTGAKLILWAEEEQQHRRSMERAALDANIAAQHSQSLTNAYTARAIFRSDMMGQTCGVLVCLVCVVGAIWMGTIGQPWVAAALAAIPTAAVVNAFRSSMFSRKRQVDEAKS